MTDNANRKNPDATENMKMYSVAHKHEIVWLYTIIIV